MKKHTGEKAYACNECDYTAIQKGNLISHMKKHKEKKAHATNVNMLLSKKEL